MSTTAAAAAGSHPPPTVITKPMNPINRIAYEYKAFRLMQRYMEQQRAAGYRESAAESAYISNCEWKYEWTVGVIPFTVVFLALTSTGKLETLKGITLLLVAGEAAKLAGIVPCTRSFVRQPSFPLAIDTRNKLRETMPDHPLVRRFDRTFGLEHDVNQPSLVLEDSKASQQQRYEEHKAEVQAAVAAKLSALGGPGRRHHPNKMSLIEHAQWFDSGEYKHSAEYREWLAREEVFYEDLYKSDHAPPADSWSKLRQKASASDVSARYRHRTRADLPFSLQHKDYFSAVDFDTTAVPSAERLHADQTK